MSDKGGNVVRLRFRERARPDAVQLLRLRRELGDAAAARATQSVLRALDGALARMERRRAEGDGEGFRRAGAQVARLAARAGLRGLARVAEQAAALSESGQSVSGDAVWSRLLRLGGDALGAGGPVRIGRG